MEPAPPPSRVAPVVDTLHGVEISDPYRWLEDGESAETKAWTERQNAYTRSFLDPLPFRERIRDRVEELWGVGLLETPRARRGRYFHVRREAEQEQAVLYLRRGPRGPDDALVDPNALAEEKLIAIDWWYPSHDGGLVAYGLSRGGDEMSTLHVLDVDARRVMADRIADTRFSSVAWLPDASGFYYARYPEGDRYNKRVRFHRLGTDPADDPLVFGEGRAPTDLPIVSLTPDGRRLLVHVAQGWARTEVYLLDRSRPDEGFRAIAAGLDAIFYAEIAGDRLFVHTDWESPNWRLLELPLDDPRLERARTVIAERADVVLTEVALAGGRIAAHELRDAISRLVVYDADGAEPREVPLPAPGSLLGISGRPDEPDLLFTYHSFLVPPVAFRHDVASGETEEFARLTPPPGFDPERYEVRRVRCVSRDGTPIPIFLVHHRDVRPDGSNPAVLTGYGGFNVNRTPLYVPALPLWLESGGVYAVAVLRGGGEFGEAWHRAGMLERKQNVFDDFVAAAEWLVRERFTSRERLCLMGGSNGGLLVGAALTQRPDLARAVVCAVPLLDMLRYHHFQIAKLWIAEYGSADDPEQFRWLHAYSPYHRVREGESYPAVLLTTALGDSRVDPMHARKMAARLQAASASGLPVLLRVESEAGHGIGKPRRKQIDESTDLWSFVFWQLGVEV